MVSDSFDLCTLIQSIEVDMDHSLNKNGCQVLSSIPDLNISIVDEEIPDLNISIVDEEIPDLNISIVDEEDIFGDDEEIVCNETAIVSTDGNQGQEALRSGRIGVMVADSSLTEQAPVAGVSLHTVVSINQTNEEVSMGFQDDSISRDLLVSPIIRYYHSNPAQKMFDELTIKDASYSSKYYYLGLSTASGVTLWQIAWSDSSATLQYHHVLREHNNMLVGFNRVRKELKLISDRVCSGAANFGTFCVVVTSAHGFALSMAGSRNPFHHCQVAISSYASGDACIVREVLSSFVQEGWSFPCYTFTSDQWCTHLEHVITDCIMRRLCSVFARNGVGSENMEISYACIFRKVQHSVLELLEIVFNFDPGIRRDITMNSLLKCCSLDKGVIIIINGKTRIVLEAEFMIKVPLTVQLQSWDVRYMINLAPGSSFLRYLMAKCKIFVLADTSSKAKLFLHFIFKDAKGLLPKKALLLVNSILQVHDSNGHMNAFPRCVESGVGFYSSTISQTIVREAMDSSTTNDYVFGLTWIQGKGGTHDLTLERLLLCSLRVCLFSHLVLLNSELHRCFTKAMQVNTSIFLPSSWIQFLCWVSEHSLHVITVTITLFRGLVLVIDVTVTIRTRYKAARRYKTTSNSIWDGGLIGVIVQRFLYGSDNEVDIHLFPKITTTVVCNCIFRIVQSFFNNPLFTLLIAWRAVISKLNTMFNSSGVRHLLGDDKQLVVLLNAYTLLGSSSCTTVQYILHNFRSFKARTVWFSVTSMITATALSFRDTILELLVQDGTGWFMVSISYLVIEKPVTHRSSKNVQCWFCTQYKLMNIVDVLAMQAQNSRLSQVLFRLDPLSYKDNGTTASDLCMLMLEVSVPENGFVRVLTLCSKESLLISSKLVKDLNIIVPTLHTKRMKNSGIKGVPVLIYHVTVGSPTFAIAGDSGYTTIFTILLGCTIQLADSLCSKYGKVNHQYYEYAAILTVVLRSNKGSPGGNYIFSPALVIKIYLIAWIAVYKLVMLMEASIFRGNSSLWKQLLLSIWFTGLLVRQPYGYQLEWGHCQLDLLQLITSSLKFFMWKGRVQVIDTREFPYMIFYFYAEVVGNRGTLMGYLCSVFRDKLVDAGWQIAWACLIQLQWHYTLTLLQMLKVSSLHIQGSHPYSTRKDMHFYSRVQLQLQLQGPYSLLTYLGNVLPL